MATTRKRQRTTTQMVQTTLTGEKEESKCHCGKICKNQRGLKIHQSRSGCSRGIGTEQRTDLSGETQENPSQDTWVKESLSNSIIPNCGLNLNGEEPITQQKHETPNQKEREAWPKMNSEAQWRELNDDLGVILETTVQGNVERRIEALTTLVYNIEKERFGIEERKQKKTTKETPNRREQKIKQIRKELKDLIKRYKESSEKEKMGIACLTDSIRDELKRNRKAEQLKNNNKKKAKHFTKNPYNYTIILLGGERSGHLICSKEEVEQYLHETHSDEEREVPLGYCPRVEKEEQQTIDLETKEPTWKEVSEVVQRARTGSAPGYSGIPYKVYKKCPKIIRKLWQLFRIQRKKGTIPESWHQAEGCFLPKEKDSKDITQFRTISLLSVQGKIYCSVLAHRITKYMVENGYIDTSMQKGGISGFLGCVEHASQLIHEAKIKKKNFDSCMVVWQMHMDQYHTN